MTWASDLCLVTHPLENTTFSEGVVLQATCGSLLQRRGLCSDVDFFDEKSVLRPLAIEIEVEVVEYLCGKKHIAKTCQ